MLVPIDFLYTTSCRLAVNNNFCDLPYPISYRCFIGTERLSPAVFEILGYWDTKRIGGHNLDLSGPRDVIGHIGHSIRCGPFPIGGLLIPSLYL